VGHDENKRQLKVFTTVSKSSHLQMPQLLHVTVFNKEEFLEQHFT